MDEVGETRQKREKNLEQKRQSIMHSDRVAFHSGAKEYSTTCQTNTCNGSFHTANQALFSHKPLKALQRQSRELQDTLSRIRLYI